MDNTVGWSGYRYDQPTRLYAVRFRFYDAVTFRWLNRDPAGYVDSMNLYGYGVSNPIAGMDPYGLDYGSWWIFGGEGYWDNLVEGVVGVWEYWTGDDDFAIRGRGVAKAVGGALEIVGGVVLLPVYGLGVIPMAHGIDLPPFSVPGPMRVGVRAGGSTLAGPPVGAAPLPPARPASIPSTPILTLRLS